MWTLLSNRGEELLLSTLKCSMIDRRTGSSRQLLRMLRKKEFLLYLKEASSTRQVLEAKGFCSEDSHSRLSKRETCVNLF